MRSWLSALGQSVQRRPAWRLQVPQTLRKVRRNLRVSESSKLLDWNSIDICVLDMDGTLLDLHFDHQVWNELLPQRFAERSGLPVAAAREHVHQVLSRQHGTLTWYCIEHWSRVFRIELTRIESELKDLITVRPGARGFLERLRDRDVRLLLATNAHAKSLARKLEITGIGQYFDAVVSSHEFGYAKEHDRFWDAFAERYEINAARTLFIDDNCAVLEAARRHGIRHLLGIARPNSRGESVQHDGFECLDNFAAMSAALSVC
jgi:HAD superfamily hydrolase (TIGR01509 family)